MSTHPDYTHLEDQADIGLVDVAAEIGGDIE